MSEIKRTVWAVVSYDDGVLAVFSTAEKARNYQLEAASWFHVPEEDMTEYTYIQDYDYFE